MEKIFKFSAVLLILLCLVISSSATAARADSEGAATVTASALNLRSEPNTSSSILATVSQGAVVLVTDDSVTGWYKVWYQGTEGYMSSEYLSFSESADSTFGTGTITGSEVRVRSGPGTNYDILGEENSGKTLSVIGVSNDWYKVNYNDSVGYVKSTYMSLSGSGSGSSSSTASSSGPSVSPLSDTGSINATYVRLRSGPSTSHSILGTYQPGTTMTVNGETGDWYKVNYDGTDGYVYKTYLTLASSSSSSSSESVTEMSQTTAYAISAVHMRTGPSTSYNSLRVLNPGISVTLTGYTDNWYRVTYNGETGYVYKTYLSTTQPSSGSSSSEGQRIVEEAKRYLGVPYVYGGSSPSGFDCSGFVQYVFKQCGYSVLRTVSMQNTNGRQVSRSELQPGDIIIFYNSSISSLGHSGIYIGDGQFIHASSGSGKIVISSLSNTYFNARYYSARRIVG